MAKLAGPLFSLEAGGPLGGALVYQGGPSGPRVGRRLRRRDSGSAGQLAQGVLFQEAVAYWKALSAGEKAGYDVVADGLGMTGYQYVLKLYMLGELGGGEPPAGEAGFVGGVVELMGVWL